ncbi:MAG: hypothetical protein HOC71_12825 [Candidatus Latescibacteria bacterium]|jgi:hypothetical protein|nr:hypothetical protein [Candidatus Latescibacterota bacterium]
MASPTITDYSKSSPISQRDNFGINRYRRSEQTQRSFLNSSPGKNRIRKTETTTLSPYSRQPTTANSLSLRKPNKPRTAQKGDIETYKRNDELFKSSNNQIRRIASLYQKTYPAMKSNVNTLPGASIQLSSTGIYSLSHSRISSQARQNATSFQLFNRNLSGITNSLSQSAGLYQKIGPKTILESQLFKLF